MSNKTGYPVNPDAWGARAGVALAAAPVVASKPLYEAHDFAQTMGDIYARAGAHNAPHSALTSPAGEFVVNNLDAASGIGAAMATHFGLKLFNERGDRVESPTARRVRVAASFVVGLGVAIGERYLGMR